jgi:acetoacetate decarboxylase
MLETARKLWGLANVGRPMYAGAIFFAARVTLNERAARAWLPPGVSLATPGTATVFVAHFPSTTFGSVYDEAGIFFHVRRRLRSAVFCPWMVVTDDVALTVGRELLGYPKKLARVDFTIGSGKEGCEVRAEVERRGKILLRLRGRVGERVEDAPPMLGQRALNVRGSLGLGAQRLIAFRPRERIVEARRASAELEIIANATHEPDRDPLGELGLGGTVLGAHLYRVDISAGLPPREVRRVGLRFAMHGMGARWL